MMSSVKGLKNNIIASRCDIRGFMSRANTPSEFLNDVAAFIKETQWNDIYEDVFGKTDTRNYKN
jgi:hypothetical protein